MEKLVACGYDFGGNLWVCKHLGLPDKIFKNLVDRHFLGCNLLICNKLEFYNEVQTELPVLDLLELYAVLYPTLYVSPSLIGMCNRFKIKVLSGVENQPLLMFEILNHMLNDLKAFAMDEKQNIISILKFMASDGFLWSSYILKFLGEDFDKSAVSYDKKDVEALKVFKVLKEFDFSELEKIDNDCEVFSINEVDTVVKLKEINNIYKEKRESQTLYSLEATKIFNNDDVLNVACCEAGTGIGKTVGYLAPVLAFLEKNPKKQVLISTYTKTLQNQIYNSIDKIVKTNKYDVSYSVATGVNNYICLLNYEYMLSYSLTTNTKIFMGFIARFLYHTRDGNMVSGDLLPFLHDYFDFKMFDSIINKQEECIYNRCPFYKKCFAMKVKFNLKTKNIIVANHSLTLLNESVKFDYMVFDEAHHLFNVSDDVFKSEISVASLIRLRGFVLGKKSLLKNNKINGLKQRINLVLDSLTMEDIEFEVKNSIENINLAVNSLVDTLYDLFKVLPSSSYSLIENVVNHSKNSVFEKFLSSVYCETIKNNGDENQIYNLEVNPLLIKNDDLVNEFLELFNFLDKILKISNKIFGLLNDLSAFFDGDNSRAILDLAKNIENSLLNPVKTYMDMLKNIFDEMEEIDDFIFRFVIEKEDGRIVNIGFFRNFLDPSLPLATSCLQSAKGIFLTSATLFMGDKNQESLKHLFKYGIKYLEGVNLVSNANFISPFDYKNNSKVIILNKDFKNTSLKANSILQFFLASNGSAIAIFTAISRLKESFKTIIKPLKDRDINLMSPYINKVNVANLMEMFREDVKSCLVGSDSIRDGIDVPGESLKLVILEKTPWLKRDILNSYRIKKFGKEFEEKEIELKMKQAFGRLIRKFDDKGIFILLDSAVPSKFLNAFPLNSEVIKNVNENDAIKIVKDFFNQ